MSKAAQAQLSPGPEDKATTHDTVDDIVRVSRRTTTPIRHTFLQRTESGVRAPGPLASFVTAGDHRALLLFLLALTKCSGEGYEVRLAAAVWARALGLPYHERAAAGTTISKMGLRIQRRRLIERKRRDRLAEVRLLREDGSGEPYTVPGSSGDRYLQLPSAFWKEGPNPELRWYQACTLPELAMLLIALSQADAFRLPLDDVPSWYGISSDTAARGFDGLVEKGLLDRASITKKAPLAPSGYTKEYRYTLKAPFGPRGVLSRVAAKAAADPFINFADFSIPAADAS